MFLIGILLFVFITSITITLGSEIYIFLDLYSLLFLILCNTAIIISTDSRIEFFYGLRLIVFKDVKVDRQKISESIKVFVLLKKSSIWISIIGFLIGSISILTRLTDLSNIELATGMGLSLLVILYCALLQASLILPVEYLLNKKLTNTESSNNKKNNAR